MTDGFNVVCRRLRPADPLASLCSLSPSSWGNIAQQSVLAHLFFVVGFLIEICPRTAILLFASTYLYPSIRRICYWTTPVGDAHHDQRAVPNAAQPVSSTPSFLITSAASVFPSYLSLFFLRYQVARIHYPSVTKTMIGVVV